MTSIDKHILICYYSLLKQFIKINQPLKQRTMKTTFWNLKEVIIFGLLSILVIPYAKYDIETKNAERSRVDSITGKDFLLTIDYSTCKRPSVANGNYDFVDSRISDYKFSLKNKDKTILRAKLFHWDYRMSNEEILNCMYKEGYRPAIFEELLIVGCVHPDWQNRFRIVELGVSTWGDGVHYHSSLGPGESGDRTLVLDYVNSTGWTHRYCFLAIKK